MSSICIVANDFNYITRNGGIGTSNWLLAHLLADSGWRVHVLYCGPVEDPLARREIPKGLARAGIGFTHLDSLAAPRPALRTLYRERWFTARSERARQALEALHRAHRFDLIEFADWGALGFRAIQSRRAELCFQDTRMIVRLQSPTQWLRDVGQAQMATIDDLQLDYCERYAAENADIQLSSTHFMLSYARKLGWHLREDARLVPNPFPEATTPRADVDSGPLEPVFFGRLGTLKGLEIFVEAAGRLDPKIPLSFLGKETQLANGSMASDYIKTQLKNRSVSLLLNLNREQALTYLSSGNRLAVIASLNDNFPNTVIECAASGIPFIASQVGGIPEIISDPVLRSELLFEPRPDDLVRALERHFAKEPASRRALVERAWRAVDVATNRRQVTAAYAELVQARPAAPPARAATDRPLVSVCVTFYNLGAYLPRSLASLAAQTYPQLEVLIVDDGSTDPASLRALEEQRRAHPRFRFLGQTNAGPGAARNRALSEARGEYFLPLDSDNVARPEMVERLVEGVRQRPELSALSCYFLAFDKPDDLERHRFRYAYRPVGGPHVLGCFENVYGDATAIFRRADLLAVGGYGTDRDTCEDWEAMVKLVNGGYRVDVLPAYLFYYRHRADSRGRMSDEHRNRQQILRQYFQLERLAEPERLALWTALASLHAQLDQPRALRYRLVDGLEAGLRRSPTVHGLVRGLSHSGYRLWQRLRPGR